MSELHTLTKQALEETALDLADILSADSYNRNPEYPAIKQAVAYLTSTITRLLEAEIERLEGMKRVTGLHTGELQFRYDLGYNTALQDHITYLKAELANIKEI